MTSIKETKRTKQKRKVKKESGEYQHTSVGNTIISFYCPVDLADIVDTQRGKISRSVFLVDTLKKALGVEEKEE